jgi:hypothetical protein
LYQRPWIEWMSWTIFTRQLWKFQISNISKQIL